MRPIKKRVFEISKCNSRQIYMHVPFTFGAIFLQQLCYYFAGAAPRSIRFMHSSPGLGKVGPRRHHLPAELPLRLRVGELEPLLERLPEDVGDLVPVQHPGPLGPGGVGGAVVEVVLVHRHRQLGVALGHLQGGAGELQAEVRWGFDLWLMSLFSRIILLDRR